MEEKQAEVRPFFIKCIITESIAVVLILLSVLILKYLNKPLFRKMEKWYKENILDDTSVSEVLQEGGDYEI